MGVAGDGALRVEWLLFEQAGIITWGQATAELSPAKVRHLVTSGRWHRVCRGVLRAGSANAVYSRDQQWWVAVLGAGDQALLSGLAAAQAGGLRGTWRYDTVDVLIPHPAHPADLLRRLPLGLPAVRIRRTRVLPPQDRQRGRPHRTSMARSLVDAAQWARTDDQAQEILAAGCQQRRVTSAALQSVLDRLPRARRRPLLRQTIRDIAGGAEALSEIDLVRLCRRYGLPVPEGQERRPDADGRTRFLDAYWRRWRLHVEVDGAHHMDVRNWAADLRRQNKVWIEGDRILRFTAFDVRRRPAEVAAQLRAALTAAGWSADPTPS
ncbi:Transcriptional regulator, AbiEi antitoxin, Type IV TA system [Micromonospora yangpuensis]|uniref:Transcriptional regulator, AbiEi antitoxin, Type IV TA system n=1 Tax=Micromonospora yangpuensis TaxID=683228 RepID=A0A1C6V8V4_9ACTN|nr:Transcriptional regulator, AbiEi antitoxin, Type IV TA system [Micromonospora yangpuensis]